MTFLVLTEKEVERKAKEDSHIGLVANALRPCIWQFGESDGNANYIIHFMQGGSYVINRRNDHWMSLKDAYSLVDNMVNQEAEKTRRSLVDALKSDITYRRMTGIENMIYSPFYQRNLSRLNGTRQETIDELNTYLERQGINKRYRF